MHLMNWAFEQQIEKEVFGIRNFMDTIIRRPQGSQIYCDVRFGGGQDVVA
jgi:hypothetical protein